MKSTRIYGLVVLTIVCYYIEVGMGAASVATEIIGVQSEVRKVKGGVDAIQVETKKVKDATTGLQNDMKRVHAELKAIQTGIKDLDTFIKAALMGNVDPALVRGSGSTTSLNRNTPNAGAGAARGPSI